MFTKKTIDGLGRVIKLGNKMKILAMDWNPKLRRFESGTKKQRNVITVLIFYMYCESAYQLYRVVTDLNNKSVPLTQYMKLVELFATRLTALLLQTIIFISHEELQYFGNQLLNMNDRFLRIYGPNHVKDPCTKTVLLWYWFARIHPALTAAMYAADNKDGRYWHGALLPGAIQPYLVPFFVLVEYWIGLYCELGSVHWGLFIIAYYRAIPIWLQQLGALVRKNTKHELVVTLYRSLLIQNRAFNNACGLMIAFGFFALLADLTLTLFCSIRVTLAIGIPAGHNFPIAVIAFILITDSTVRPAGNLTLPSSEFLALLTSTVSGKRYSRPRRMHTKSMEKERKKGLKVKQSQSNCKGDDERLTGCNKSAKWISKLDGNCSETWSSGVRRLNSHFALKSRRPGGAKQEDIDGIRMARVMKVISAERVRSLQLTATAKSMYPLFVNCFTFFQFDKSTIFEFYSAVLDQTISALLLS